MLINDSGIWKWRTYDDDFLTHPDSPVPDFLTSIGIEDVSLPNKMAGIYHLSETEEGVELTRHAILTSRGWVPPVPSSILKTADSDIHNSSLGSLTPAGLAALTEVRSHRISAHPSDVTAFAARDDKDVTVTHDDVHDTAFRHPNMFSQLDFYIPDTFPEFVGVYLAPAARPFAASIDRPARELRDMMRDALLNFYPISTTEARSTVLNIEDAIQE